MITAWERKGSMHRILTSMIRRDVIWLWDACLRAIDWKQKGKEVGQECSLCPERTLSGYGMPV